MIVYLFISYLTDLYTIPLNLALFIFVFNYCDRAISQSKFDGINSINLILKLMILYQSSRKKTVICTKKNKNLCEFWSDKWPFIGELFFKTQCNATSCEDGRCQETINNITVNVVLREKGAKHVSSLVLKSAKSCHSKSGQVLHTRGVSAVPHTPVTPQLALNLPKSREQEGSKNLKPGRQAITEGTRYRTRIYKPGFSLMW